LIANVLADFLLGKNMKGFLAAISFILISSTAFAEPIDGYYAKIVKSCFPNSRSSECANVEEGLTFKQRTHNTFYIYVVTRGDNGHFCKYTGIAQLIEGNYVASEGDCTITISISNGIANLSSSKGCSAYCGARATLESSDMRKKEREKKK
jgi:hypothetical protein